MVVHGQVLVVSGFGTLSFLHHRLKFPVHVLEIFQDAVFHHTDTQKGVTQLFGGDKILFPEDAVVVVGEPGGDLLQFISVASADLPFALPFSHKSGVTNSLVPNALSSPSMEIFTMMGAFPSRFLTADLLM